MTAGHTLHDEQVVDQLLFETGCGDEPGLRGVLLDLRCFADGPPVIPSTGLAALMVAAPAGLERAGLERVGPEPADPEPANPEPVSLDALRRRKHRRTTLTVLAVAASMGAGTAAVAATDPGFRETAQQTITTVVEAVTHGHSGRPAPAPAHNAGSTQSPGNTPKIPDLPAPAQNAPGRAGTTPGEPAATPPAHPTKPSPGTSGALKEGLPWTAPRTTSTSPSRWTAGPGSRPRS